MFRLLSAILFVSGCLFPAMTYAEGAKAYALPDGRLVAPLELFRDCEACPEMIVMPEGSFMMGAIPGESKNPFDFYGKNAKRRKRGPGEINIIPFEHPRHPLEMDISYAIGRNEITRAEWMACVEDGGCSYVPDHRAHRLNGYETMGPKHPVINVSYLDVQEYIDWLNRQVGAEVYRLPTEAEWEYAARAGTKTPFAQGESLTKLQANFSRAGTENLLGTPQPQLANRYGPVPVDELDAANGWGVRHMSGNVLELTLSCFAEEHLGLPTDSAYLADAVLQKSCRRVAKGGAFNSGMDHCRLATRIRPTETTREYDLGFRIIRELTAPAAQ